MEELKENLEKQTAEGDGFSRTFTQEEEASGMPEDSKYPNFYMVYFGTMHNRYYFHIDAETGILAEVDHSESGKTKKSDGRRGRGIFKRGQAKTEREIRQHGICRDGDVTCYLSELINKNFYIFLWKILRIFLPNLQKQL